MEEQFRVARKLSEEVILSRDQLQPECLEHRLCHGCVTVFRAFVMPVLFIGCWVSVCVYICL